jgi:hypothetical protein
MRMNFELIAVLLFPALMFQVEDALAQEQA